MARPRKHVPLDVFLNTRHVGRLTKQSSGAIDFQYDQDWLEWDNTMPISLSLPLREDRYIGAPVQAVFENLLPDTDQIRRRMAERTGAQGIDAFSLLSAVGRDCVGALQFLPEGERPDPDDALSGDVLSEEDAAALISSLASAPLGLGEDEHFRISVAGAQEKTALLRKDGKWLRPHGTTPTTHILKPQIGTLPNGLDLSNSVENEHLCLKLMGAFGLDVAETEIADFGERRVLVVERFDRRYSRDGKRLLRVPQEDMCQALGVPPTLKYQNEGGPGMLDILEHLKASDQPDADRKDFLKSQMLFWLLGATDGHAKNFSVFILPKGRFQMTPIYDVISAQPSLDAGQLQRKQMTMAMSVGNSRHYRIDEIAVRHFIQTAAQAKISETTINQIVSEIADEFPRAWDRVTFDLPKDFPDDLIGSIYAGMEARMRMIALANAK